MRDECKRIIREFADDLREGLGVGQPEGWVKGNNLETWTAVWLALSEWGVLDHGLERILAAPPYLARIVAQETRAGIEALRPPTDKRGGQR